MPISQPGIRIGWKVNVSVALRSSSGRFKMKEHGITHSLALSGTCSLGSWGTARAPKHGGVAQALDARGKMDPLRRMVLQLPAVPPRLYY